MEESVIASIIVFSACQSKQRASAMHNMYMVVYTKKSQGL